MAEMVEPEGYIVNYFPVEDEATSSFTELKPAASKTVTVRDFGVDSEPPSSDVCNNTPTGMFNEYLVRYPQHSYLQLLSSEYGESMGNRDPEPTMHTPFSDCRTTPDTRIPLIECANKNIFFNHLLICNAYFDSIMKNFTLRQ